MVKPTGHRNVQTSNRRSTVGIVAEGYEASDSDRYGVDRYNSASERTWWSRPWDDSTLIDGGMEAGCRVRLSRGCVLEGIHAAHKAAHLHGDFSENEACLTELAYLFTVALRTVKAIEQQKRLQACQNE